jgi:hypothetical protein
VCEGRAAPADAGSKPQAGPSPMGSAARSGGPERAHEDVAPADRGDARPTRTRRIRIIPRPGLGGHRVAGFSAKSSCVCVWVSRRIIAGLKTGSRLGLCDWRGFGLAAWRSTGTGRLNLPGPRNPARAAHGHDVDDRDVPAGPTTAASPSRAYNMHAIEYVHARGSSTFALNVSRYRAYRDVIKVSIRWAGRGCSRAT